MYTAIVLDEEDQEWLRQFCEHFQLPDWERKCHHLTFYMGDIKEEHRPYIGKAFLLSVNAVGSSDKAIALRVTDIHCCESLPMTRIVLEKAIPHVTLLVNTLGGGKPKDSNDITDWRDMDGRWATENVVLRGRLQVVK